MGVSVLVLALALMLMLLSFTPARALIVSRAGFGHGIVARALGAKTNSVRPTIEDVERISKGQRARKRGVGSRAVPHRLNEAERKEFEVAKRKGFVSLRSTGWRAERGDSPLANLFRNYCDAMNQPCVSIQRGVKIDAANTVGDQVIVDLSPLRMLDVSAEARAVRALLCLENGGEGGEENKQRDIIRVHEGSVVDNTDAAAMEWDVDSLGTSLQEDPIWRAPALAIMASFAVRADAKTFADAVVSMQLRGHKDF